MVMRDEGLLDITWLCAESCERSGDRHLILWRRPSGIDESDTSITDDRIAVDRVEVVEW